MPIDQSTIVKITKWINEKWKNKNCHLCAANSWDINGYVLLSLQDMATSGIVFGGPVLPSAAVVCKNCGNTHIINLVIAGAVPGAFIGAGK